MLVHIGGGSIALLSGAGALAVGKGGRWHGRFGTAFFTSMLVMASTGAVVAALRPERGTAVIGIFTCYLVATAWSAARRRDGKAGRLEHVALAVALACLAALVLLGIEGMNHPRGRVDSLPWPVHFVFGSVAALAAALDVNFILRRQLSGVQRIGRHLWRMSAAMFIATSSFFQGQEDEFPEAWQGAILWDALPLIVLAAMIFWMFRVRFSTAYRSWPPRIAKRTKPPEPESIVETA
jgi:hypothetical protein